MRAAYGSVILQDGEHRDLMLGAIAAEGEGHAALLAGDTETARAVTRAVDGYRASWALAPPRSYGRLGGLSKAAADASGYGDARAANEGAFRPERDLAAQIADPLVQIVRAASWRGHTSRTGG